MINFLILFLFLTVVSNIMDFCIGISVNFVFFSLSCYLISYDLMYLLKYGKVFNW